LGIKKPLPAVTGVVGNSKLQGIEYENKFSTRGE